MKVQQFLEHHGQTQNPFSQEDAQTDSLFKQHCSKGTFHPAWDKIYGDPGSPATAVVFGEKGSGKTALRLQIVDHSANYNSEHPDKRVFIIEYDDFNPFLDCFDGKISWPGGSPERTLGKWRLGDHIDCILSLGVTKLIDDIFEERIQGKPGPFEVRGENLQNLTRPQKRDFLLLACLYDRSTDAALQSRWTILRRKLRFPNWKTWREIVIGTAISLGVFGILAEFGALSKFGNWWVWMMIVGGWVPWLSKQTRLGWVGWKIQRHIRVLERQFNTLRQTMAKFEQGDLAGQPLPSRERSDDRYELLNKLQGILQALGFETLTILVDRVDEPRLINGSAERMKAFLWPLFDNKFLKHAGLGIKLLLPVEVSLFLQREDREFYERSRLDKQNLIRSLEWTGESLYDLANDRIRACHPNLIDSGDSQPSTGLKSWFDDSINESELVSILARLRVPRHLFKFLHRLLVEHCHRYTDESPRWQIGRETLQSTMAVYMRDLEAYDRGLGTG
ncbi:MAG: hypothetical protein NTW75_15445 [Planctomycetales bacterium]|jgi:hypothetical protein|nr:hypothetical protein [Planctomycetales bacterium]